MNYELVTQISCFEALKEGMLMKKLTIVVFSLPGTEPPKRNACADTNKRLRAHAPSGLPRKHPCARGAARGGHLDARAALTVDGGPRA